MKIRAYTENDAGAVAALFTASVHELGSPHYDTLQRHAWAPRPPDPLRWSTRLAGLHTLLAEEGDELAGFISYECDGHIELLFTAPGFARRGVASFLYQHMEHLFVGASLFTEASLAAKPFFLRQGFQVVEEQDVERNGITLRRFANVQGRRRTTSRTSGRAGFAPSPSAMHASAI
jgi:putative acetyltransferase